MYIQSYTLFQVLFHCISRIFLPLISARWIWDSTPCPTISMAVDYNRPQRKPSWQALRLKMSASLVQKV